MFVLLRHAHAVDRRSWEGPDDGRPLSPQGRGEAMALIGHLAGLPVARLVSSPLLRCRQTLEPLSSHLGITIQASDLLVPDAEPPELARFAADPTNADGILCTHGETLDALLGYWQQSRRIRLPVPPQRVGKRVTEKSGGWMISEAGGSLQARYLPPPAAQDEWVP
ncbi:MAG TPA: phosphoglycerate mutase family protein [Kineosporiaceae bacterium]|nr:phosphoglycerate mutase family protein [Kineosporiaceae bacterium]